jgi:hypothetical protein
MARKVHVTHIQTSADRAAGNTGESYSEHVAAADDRRRKEAADAKEKSRSDKTYGLALDGSGTYTPAPRWPWIRR